MPSAIEALILAGMKWLSSSLDRLKDLARAEPIDCPRGWGEVSFVAEVSAFWPFISFERQCPISGTQNCASCRHACNPDRLDQLKAALKEVEQLHADGTLTAEELRVRRAAIVRFQDFLENTTGRRDSYRTAAWILGPLGVLFTAVGGWLVATKHPAFWTLAGSGAIMLALTISFGVLAAPRDDDAGSRP